MSIDKYNRANISAIMLARQQKNINIIRNSEDVRARQFKISYRSRQVQPQPPSALELTKLITQSMPNEGQSSL